MIFWNRFSLLVLSIALFGFSEAQDRQLDYFDQQQHLEDLNLLAQPNQLQNHHGQVYQHNSPDQFEQLGNSNQDQKSSLQGQREQFGRFNEPQFRSAAEEHHQQNHNRMLNYPDQFRLHSSPNQDQHLQHQAGNHNEPQLPNYVDEHQQLNHHDMLNYPSEIEQLSFPNHQLHHRAEFEQFLGEPPFLSPAGQSQQSKKSDQQNVIHRDQFHPLSYHSLSEQPIYRGQEFDQQGHFEQSRNVNHPYIHDAAPEYHQLNYHDMLGYPNGFQQRSYSNPDQQLKQQSEIEKHGNTNGHQQLNYNGTGILEARLNNNARYSRQLNKLNPDHPDSMLRETTATDHKPEEECEKQPSGDSKDRILRHAQMANVHHPQWYPEQPGEFQDSNLNRKSSYSDNMQQFGNYDHDWQPHKPHNAEPFNRLNGPHLRSYHLSNNHDIGHPAADFARNNGDYSMETDMLNYRQQGYPEQSEEPRNPRLNEKSSNSDYPQQHNNHGLYPQLNSFNQFNPVGQFRHRADHQQRSYFKEDQLENNRNYEIPSAGSENIAEYHNQMQNRPQGRGYPQQTDIHGAFSVNLESSYGGPPQEPSDPDNSWHLNQPYLQDNLQHSSDFQLLNEAQQPDHHDTGVGLENNVSHSQLLQASNHHEYQMHPNETKEANYSNLNEHSGHSDHQQGLTNPERFFKPNHTKLNEKSHEYINTTDHQHLNISGGVENTAANVLGLINTENQGPPGQAVNSSSANQTTNLSHMDLFQQVHNSGSFQDQSREKRKLDLLHAGVSENQTQQLNDSEILHQQNHFNQSEDLNATSSPTNQNQLQQLVPLLALFKQFNFSGQVNRIEDSYQIQMHGNFTGYQPQNYSGHPPDNVPQDQNEEQHLSGNHQQNNESSQADHPVSPDAMNLTVDQVQGYHPLNPQQIRLRNEYNQSGNQNESQLNHNLTDYQQQNSSDSPNGNTSASHLINPETHQPIPDLSTESHLRQERQLTESENTSQQENVMYPGQAQQLNYFNPSKQPNQFQQPMKKPYGLAYFPGNQHLNYPVLYPEACYLEKAHGSCQASIPRYYFDPNTRHCAQFMYGGCQGNANNFLTMRECELSCMIQTSPGASPVHHSQTFDYNDLHYQYPDLPLWHPGPDLVHEVCNIEHKRGPCRAAFTRYFYNPASRNCEQFVYGGCFGNANNFFTKEECQFVCMSHK